MKTEFSSPVATAEFSKFAGILSAALSPLLISREALNPFMVTSDPNKTFCKTSLNIRKFMVSPGISLEGMMLKLKLQYFGHFMRRVDSLEKTDAGRDWGQEKKGTTEDEMAGWHH